MAKKFRREHIISFATTAPQKAHIEAEANKAGLRLSRFVSNTIEEKIGPPPELEDTEQQ